MRQRRDPTEQPQLRTFAPAVIRATAPPFDSSGFRGARHQCSHDVPDDQNDEHATHTRTLRAHRVREVAAATVGVATPCEFDAAMCALRACFRSADSRRSRRARAEEVEESREEVPGNRGQCNAAVRRVGINEQGRLVPRDLPSGGHE